MTIDTTKPLEALAQKVTCEILGFKDWGDATDYRTTGKEDRERDRILGIVQKALRNKHPTHDWTALEADAFRQMLIDARWPDLEEGVSEYVLAEDAWNAGKAYALQSQPSKEVVRLWREEESFDQTLIGAMDLRDELREAKEEGWDIAEGRWPEPPYNATHKDYDASHEGAEDGWVDNGLSASAVTLRELLDEIAEIERHHPHFASIRPEEVKSGMRSEAFKVDEKAVYLARKDCRTPSDGEG